MKITIAVSCFSKRSILDAWQGSEYVSGSEYPKVLNMSLLLNMPEFLDILGFWKSFWFWICQRILNIPELWISQGYIGFRICLNNSWICLNMSEYARICMNMLKSAWMAFGLHFPISPFVLQSLFSLNTLLLIWTSRRD